VAYFTGPARQPALRAAARSRLPEYMVPSAFVPLDVFPLNSNGKIDRKQLPRPTPGRADGTRLQPPRNDLEIRIEAVWRETLGVSQVGVDEDFFALGGTSAHAIETVARMRGELGMEVPVQLLYEAPTVEKLALRLSQAFSPDDPIVIRLRRGSAERPPLFCLLGVNQYLELALALEWDRPVIAVHVPCRYVPGRDSPPTMEEIAQRYVAQIQRQQAHGPYYLLGLCFGGVVAYEAARQLQAAGEAVPFVAVLDAILPAGFQADRLTQARHYLRRARQDPRRVLAWAGKVARGAGHLVLPSDRREAASQQPVDLSVDGPTADRLVERFATEPKTLRSRLLIVHASAEESHPPWIRIRSDLGWAGWADRIVEHAIAASHLRILREPHVRGLAAVLEREMG
jgi:thioesterase domain-containing protein